MELEIGIVAAGREGQDAAAVFSTATGHLIVVADGAGGTSGGRQAAELAVAICGEAATAGAVHDLVGLLHDIDGRLRNDPGAGQSTAVVIHAADGELSGASVGDSEAWLIAPGSVEVLTARQRHKPLLGARRAIPAPLFARLSPGHVLLVASDGLFKYAARQAVIDAVLDPAPAAPSRLVACARLASGTLQDDVAVVVVRQQ